MLQVEKLTKTFHTGVLIKKPTPAVKEASFQIKTGEIMGLAGNSGCGKTTLSRMILGIVTPDSGQILYHGKSIASFGKGEMKQYHKDVQIIFQNPEGSMNPSFKILDNLLEPMIIHGVYSTREQRTNKISELMAMVGLPERLLLHYPHQISGGEAQRLVICRALTIDPKLLILDEPTSMLDVSIQAHVMTLLRELKEKLGLTYLYISHDIDLHRWFTDDLMIMNCGAIVELGNTEQLLKSPQQEYTKVLLHSFAVWDETE